MSGAQSRGEKLVSEEALQRQIAAVAAKRRGVEIRRAETAGGVIGKSVASLRFAEHAGRELRLIPFGMKERNGVGSGWNAAEHASRRASADRRDHAAPFLADFRKCRGRIEQRTAYDAIAVACPGHRDRQFADCLR